MKDVSVVVAELRHSLSFTDMAVPRARLSRLPSASVRTLKLAQVLSCQRHHATTNSARSPRLSERYRARFVTVVVTCIDAKFTPPTRRDKTVLSVSRLVRRCELDDCSERAQTSNFLPATVLSCLDCNSHRRRGHETDKTVLSCLAWRCELALRHRHPIIHRVTKNEHLYF